MGGAKKRSMAQAEKQQQLQTTKQDKSAQKSAKSKSTKTSGANVRAGEIGPDNMKELAAIKSLTPYSVATRFNIKISAAKDMLQTLEEHKTVELVASGRGAKIYRLVGTP